MEDKVAAVSFHKSSIVVDVSGIAFKVLRGTELHGINEIRYHSPVVVPVRGIDKACVSLVEIAHCRHETYCEPLSSPFLDLCAYFRYCLYYFHISHTPS